MIYMKTFFIADDDYFQHFVYQDFLESHGHKIVGHAYNGQECYDKIRDLNDGSKKLPDIIIMDHKMPVKNGLETMISLLKLKPGMKIIVISGDDSIEKEAISAGASGFLMKPFKINTLLEYLRTNHFIQ